MKYTAPKGTRDILPGESALWQKVERAAAEVFALYNYQEIRTPIFESIELFSRSIGETSDIVKKEMYVFKDQGERTLALRPEATASVVRAALENNLLQEGRITKLYYSGPMFRAERPQAGHYRQFSQIGVEAFGARDPKLDAEVILLNKEPLSTLQYNAESLVPGSRRVLSMFWISCSFASGLFYSLK